MPDQPTRDARATDRALAQTIPGSAFAPGLAQRWLEQRAASERAHHAAAVDAPALADPGLTARLGARGLAWSGEDGARYAAHGALGAGSTGRVFAVADHVLGREIAIKLLDRDAPATPEEIAGFIDEARVTASLEHPNVLPVYDLDVDQRGRPWFSMRTARGRSLGVALRAAIDGSATPPIDSVNGVISVFIQVCNALSFAHHRGVVHQDVKPDNILLGDFGEVLLLDWGSALVVGGRQRIYGTPLYMSPEQARREGADARSDVYCVGACLFHVLIRRLPTWHDDEAEFWQRKRDGRIVPPLAEERRGVPAPLVAIVLKALAARAVDRYPTIDALAEDLRACQAGFAVSAWRGSVLERFRAWHRRHARTLWTAAAMAAVVVACAVVLYGEKLKEIATWGRPIVEEDFTDPSWRQRWRTIDGGFADRAGEISSTGPVGNVLLFERRWHGPVAIEFDGRIEPGSEAGDLSAMWFTADDADDIYTPPVYMFEVGGRDNRIAGITTILGEGNLVVVPLTLDLGRQYRVRAEVDGAALRLYLDGVLLCEHHVTVPFTSGRLALFGFSPGKTFDRVAIYALGVPEKPGALAIGDSYVENDLLDLAARQYRRAREAHPDRPLAEEARLKEGRCLFALGREAEAEAVWAELTTPALRRAAQCQRLEARVDDHAAVLAGIADLHRSAPDDRDLALRLRGLWTLAAQRATEQCDLPTLAGYAALYDDAFAADRSLDHTAGRIYLKLGWYERLVERFAHDHELCGWALGALGRDEECLERFPGRYNTGAALLNLGRYEEALAVHESQVTAALMLGRFDLAREFAAAGAPGGEWIDLHDQPIAGTAKGGSVPIEVTIAALTLSDRLDEALILAQSASPAVTWRTLLSVGRADQALRENPGSRERRAAIAAWSMLQARIASDATGERRWRQAFADEAMAIGYTTTWFERWLMLPLLDEEAGEVGAFARSLDAALGDQHAKLHAQRLRFAALRIAGRIDDAAFLAQPTRIEAPALMLLCDALRSERGADPAAALIAYRAWRALPPNRRGIAGIQRDDTLWRFVDWRIARLAPGDIRGPHLPR